MCYMEGGAAEVSTEWVCYNSTSDYSTACAADSEGTVSRCIIISHSLCRTVITWLLREKKTVDVQTIIQFVML